MLGNPHPLLHAPRPPALWPASLELPACLRRHMGSAARPRGSWLVPGWQLRTGQDRVKGGEKPLRLKEEMEGLVEPGAGGEAEPGTVSSLPAVGEGGPHSTEPGGGGCHEALTATLERSRHQCCNHPQALGYHPQARWVLRGCWAPSVQLELGSKGLAASPPGFCPPQRLLSPSWGCSHPARKTGCWR